MPKTRSRIVPIVLTSLVALSASGSLWGPASNVARATSNPLASEIEPPTMQWLAHGNVDVVVDDATGSHSCRNAPLALSFARAPGAFHLAQAIGPARDASDVSCAASVPLRTTLAYSSEPTAPECAAGQGIAGEPASSFVAYASPTEDTVWTFVKTVARCDGSFVEATTSLAFRFGHVIEFDAWVNDTSSAPFAAASPSSTGSTTHASGTAMSPTCANDGDEQGERNEPCDPCPPTENDGDKVDLASCGIQVQPPPPPVPPVDFAWSQAACSGTTVSFTDSTNAAGAPFPTAWRWSFGDAGTSTQQNPSHTYAAAGTYTVTLTVTFSDGRSASKTHSVAVTSDTCKRTYAAGDRIGNDLYVTGDDPGCAIGDTSGAPDSSTAGSPSSTLALSIPGGAPVARANMLSERWLHGGAAMPMGGVFATPHLVIGGGTKTCQSYDALPFAPLKTSASYDPGANAWTAQPDMNVARIAPATAYVPPQPCPVPLVPCDDQEGVYFAGGDGSGGDETRSTGTHTPTPAVERFDGSAWTRLPDLPAGVVGGAGGYRNGTYVVTGGFSHPQTTNRLAQVFDLATGRWVGHHLPDPLTAHQAGSCHVPATFWTVGGMAGADAPMHDFDPARATDALQVYDGLDWQTTGHLPIPLTYHQATSIGPEVYVFGGITPSGGGAAVSNRILSIDCLTGLAGPDDTLGTLQTTIVGTAGSLPIVGPIITSTLTPNPAVADGAMEASNGVLWVFGGTTTVGPAPHYLPGCPTTSVYSIVPATGLVVSWPAVTLPTAVAAMGHGVLPDGRIVLVGGRVSAGGTCYAPTNQVLIFDPVTQTFTNALPLPAGLIAPAVAVYGWNVYVAGGDDVGDTVAPPLNSPTAERPRHPANVLYSAQIDPLSGVTGAAPIAAWTNHGEMPMGVVRGQFVAPRYPEGHVGDANDDGTKCSTHNCTNDRDMWLVGGSHHPNASVRLVQELAGPWIDFARTVPPLPLGCIGGIVDHRTNTNTCLVAWNNTMLDQGRGFHALELCTANGHWFVQGGVQMGLVTPGRYQTVYHTEPNSVNFLPGTAIEGEFQDDFWKPGSWTTVGTPPSRAFPVGHSLGGSIDLATGTSPGAGNHRTRAMVSFPCDAPQPPPDPCPPPYTDANGNIVITDCFGPQGPPWATAALDAPEPSTPRDDSATMWFDPNTAPVDRIYFRLQMTPARTFAAYLGYWRDCNHDGIIGEPEAETYALLSTLTPVDTTVCPVGSAYNDGSIIHEFLWIGPGASASQHAVNDPTARIWVDWGYPDDPAANAPKRITDDELHFDPNAVGPRWVSARVWAASASLDPMLGGATAYAHVSDSSFMDSSAVALGINASGGSALPSGTTEYYYGSTPCGGHTSGIYNGWDCDATDWLDAVRVYDPFELRDVDCFTPTTPNLNC